MPEKKLDQLDPNELAVVEYLYRLSSPPDDALQLFDQVVRGLSHFMIYVANAANEPGMLSFLPGRSVKNALALYGTQEAMGQHVLEVVMQKVLIDDEHTPETHPYTTPLLLPPKTEGEPSAYMPRFTLYMYLCGFVSGGIEGVNDELRRTIGPLVGIKLQSAIQHHYRPWPRKPKA